MHSSGNDLWKKQWTGLLGGLLLAACGAPDPELPGSPGVAQAPLTWPLYAEYDPSLKTFTTLSWARRPGP